MKKNIDGYDGVYEIYCDGRVYSCAVSRFLTPCDCWSSYEGIRLTKNGITKKYYVHRLVANHFVPNPDCLPEVNHKDGNKRNNHYMNLEWCTRSENMKHASKTGLQRPMRGMDNGCSKLTDKDIQEIRRLYPIYKNYTHLGRMFNVTTPQVMNIVHRKQWKHIK